MDKHFEDVINYLKLNPELQCNEQSESLQTINFPVGCLDELLDIIDIDQSICKLLPYVGGVAALVTTAVNTVPQAAFAYYSFVKVSSMTRQFLFDAECKANLRVISKKAKEEAKESLLSVNILDIIKQIKV